MSTANSVLGEALHETPLPVPEGKSQGTTGGAGTGMVVRIADPAETGSKWTPTAQQLHAAILRLAAAVAKGNLAETLQILTRLRHAAPGGAAHMPQSGAMVMARLCAPLQIDSSSQRAEALAAAGLTCTAGGGGGGGGSLKEYYLNRLNPGSDGSSQASTWGMGTSSRDAVVFRVDKPIIILGVGSYGGNHGIYEPKCEIFKDSGGSTSEGSGLAVGHSSYSGMTHQEVMRVYYDKAVYIEPDTDYCLTQYMKNGSCSGFYGSNGSSSRKHEASDIQFTFKSASGSTNGSDTGSGQIPRIYFAPAPGPASAGTKMAERATKWLNTQLKKGFKKSALKEDGSEVGAPKHKIKDKMRDDAEIGGDGTGSRTSGGGGGGTGGGGEFSFVPSAEIPEDDEGDKSLLATGLSPAVVSGSFIAGVDSAPILPEGTLRTDGASFGDVSAGISITGTDVFILSADGRSVQIVPIKAIGAGSKSFTGDQWGQENEGDTPDPASEAVRAAIEAAGAQARASQTSISIGDEEVGMGVAAIADRVFVRVIPASAGAATGGGAGTGAAIVEAAEAPIRIAAFDRNSLIRVGTITVQETAGSPALGGGFGLATDGSLLYVPTVQLTKQGVGAAISADGQSPRGLGTSILATVDPFTKDLAGGVGGKSTCMQSAHALSRAAHLVLQDGITSHEALCRLSHLTDGRIVLAAARESSEFSPPGSEDDEEEGDAKLICGYQVYGERMCLVDESDAQSAGVASDGARLVSCMPARGNSEDYSLPAVRPDALAFNSATCVVMAVDASNARVAVMVNPATP